MNTDLLLDVDQFESTVLPEAADKLNFIWRLAHAYEPPELLQFLEDLTGKLVERREFVKTSLDAWRTKRSH